jgi:cell fate regulator YaaT (PSP1 superfamily)
MQVFDWLADLGVDSARQTFEVAQVEFKARRNGFYRFPASLDIRTGDYVIVEADRGVDFGRILLMGELVRLRLRKEGIDDRIDDLPAIERAASEHDVERWQANRDKEPEAFHIVRKSIDHFSLPMKLVDAEWQFDGRKITFYFSADGRVDFRLLVRDLASKFRTRVELRQIGARDEAARIGGIGSCGRELCCSTWLQEFQPVTTQSAKIQNLPLNPTRLSGQCGRLKCCLNYELEQYMEALNAFPSIGSRIRVDGVDAVVHQVDIFRGQLLVERRDGSRELIPVDRVTA